MTNETQDTLEKKFLKGFRERKEREKIQEEQELERQRKYGSEMLKMFGKIITIPLVCGSLLYGLNYLNSKQQKEPKKEDYSPQILTTINEISYWDFDTNGTIDAISTGSGSLDTPLIVYKREKTKDLDNYSRLFRNPDCQRIMPKNLESAVDHFIKSEREFRYEWDKSAYDLRRK